MSPAEQRLLEFVAARLESLLESPEVWGSDVSVEDQVLQLLELRRFVLDPSISTNDTQKLMQDYVKFINESVEEPTAEPLAIQLRRRGKEGEFTGLLRKFAQRELAAFVSSAQFEHVIVRAQDIEMTIRMMEHLYAQAVLHVRRVPHAYEAFNFPLQTHRT